MAAAAIKSIILSYQYQSSTNVISHGNDCRSIHIDNGENGGDSTEDDDHENEIDSRLTVPNPSWI